MRAATIVDGRLEIRAHPDPEPGHGQLLVRVRAAGLNRADLMQLDGGYPAPPGWPADIPGLELAGEVASTGAGVTRFRVGDRVMAVVGGGGQAELAVVHEREAVAVPESLGWDEAGGFPEAFTTAYDAVFTQADLRMGERLLVHGAAGGVGTAAVQLGVAAGADVVASVRDPTLRPDVRGLGARVVAPEDVAAHAPYDVIVELVGAVNLETNLRSLGTGGRIAVIGLGAGAIGEIDLGLLMAKRARMYGSTLRARPLEGKADAARAVEVHVVPLVASGRVRVPVCDAFALEEVVEAYGRFAAGSKFGKVVLTVGEG